MVIIAKNYVSTASTIDGVARKMLKLAEEDPKCCGITTVFSGIRLYATKGDSVEDIVTAYIAAKTKQSSPVIHLNRARRQVPRFRRESRERGSTS